MVCLDNAKGGGILTLIECIQPALERLLEGHVLRHEFEILHAAFGDDQLDILDISCRGIARELADAGNAVVLKPLLEVGIKGAGLEEAIAKEHHSLVGVIKLLKYTGIEKCFTVPDYIFDVCFFFLGNEIVILGFLYANGICLEAADSVSNDEDGFFRKLDGAFDATQCQGSVGLPGCLI